MPRYRYKALAPNGELVVGRVSAGARDEAIRKLRDRGIVPLEAEADAKTRTEPRFFARLGSGTVTRREILVFTRELATLLRAGISLDRAIDKLAETRAGGALGKLLRSVSSQVKSGSTLAGALAKTSDAFLPFYTGLIRAGEASGTLPSVLDDLAGVIQSSQELRDRVTGSMVYPCIVLVLIAVSFAILMGWVIPEFRPLLERPGAEVPFSATLILFLSGMIVDWGWLIAVMLGVGLLLMLRLARSGALRPYADRAALRVPQIGGIVRQIEAAKFCRSLGTLLSNGVSLLDAVDLATATVSNGVVARALSSTKPALQRGTRLAEALGSSGAIPPIAMQIVDVGDESGNLDEMLFLAASTCQQDAQRALDQWVVFLLPIVTVVLGIFVAVIIGSILSAILSTYNVPF